jgi:Tol biopolymer transport system component
MKTHRFASFFVVALAALGIAGCGGDRGSGGCTGNCGVQGKVTVTCVPQLQIGVTSSNYTCTASESVSWSVDNTSLATITSSGGVLTPNKTTAGTITVTATATSGNDTPGTATVNVVDWILYQNGGAVMVMNSDGSNQVSLLPKTAGCGYPTWSYDHLKFVCESNLSSMPTGFMVYSTDGTASGTIEANTLNLNTIGGLDTADFPHFSPDEKTIVFTGFKQTTVGSTNEDVEGVWTIGSDGTGLIERAVEPYGDGILIENPRFSPDGTEILYQKGENVWVMNADGSNPHQLVNALSSMAIFSPDMTKLYYINNYAGNDNLTILANADGSDPVQISSAGYYIEGVSPNGKSIVFWNLNVDTGEVIVANADGSSQKNIAVGAPTSW